MKLNFRIFRSGGFIDTEVEPTAQLAAIFASEIGPAKLVNVSHVMDGHMHIVTV